MGTVHTALPAQTLYVTVRRDELRQLKDERDQLQLEVMRLRAHIIQAQLDQPYGAQPALC